MADEIEMVNGARSELAQGRQGPGLRGFVEAEVGEFLLVDPTVHIYQRDEAGQLVKVGEGEMVEQPIEMAPYEGGSAGWVAGALPTTRRPSGATTSTASPNLPTGHVMSNDDTAKRMHARARSLGWDPAAVVGTDESPEPCEHGHRDHCERCVEERRQRLAERREPGR